MNQKSKIIKIILLTCISIFFIVTIYHKITSKNLLTKIFGVSILIVNSGSMEPEIKLGEAIIILQKNDYKCGDIVTCNINNKYLITHRIVEKNNKEFVTKGDYNNIKDEQKIIIEDIEGKVILHSKILGLIIKYRIFIFLFLILLLIVSL